MTSLHIAPTPTYARELIGATMRQHAGQQAHPLEILEAGCGRTWNIDLSDLDYRLTGVDLDAHALGHRTDVVGDLDEAIVGDLRTVELLEAHYDVVFSAFVLEHIAGAERVLDRLVEALRPGGLLILRVPDGRSVYAFLARRLPFRMHVWYKRLSEHDPQAGHPGHPPYPVVYDPVVCRNGLQSYADRHGLVLVSELGTNPHLDAMGRLAPIGRLGQRVVSLLSAGRLDGTHSNLTLVYRRP